MHDAAARAGHEAFDCGCVSPARWQCPACAASNASFLACCRPCLQRHQRKRHGGGVPSLPDTARRNLVQGNRQHAQNWALYEAHRGRLARLLGAVQRGEGLCVLGAGNCDDLDLPRLVSLFGDVHLVDLDGEAMERGLERVPPAQRARVVLHADLDLSGLLGSVQAWADDFPDAQAFRPRQAAAVAALAARVGRTFDVVLSAGVLSQLCVPFFRLLAARLPEWAALMQAVAQVHAGTMAALLRPEGTGVLVGDIPYALGASAAVEPQAPSWDTLSPEVMERLRDGVLMLRRPDYLLQLIGETPGLERPQLTEPWLWSQEEAVMLAYAVLFRRAGGAA